MDERAQRIVGIAIELAERDGYAAVRLRDVAAQAGVAPEGDAPTQALAGPEDERPPPRSKAVETK